MAMSKGANTYNRQNWEESDFPLLCQTCLGDNPYIRMMKEKHGKECKTCNRPFTVFRWCPGARMRFKKTEVCQTCSQMKNICQTCLLDLEYGLPVQVRDAALRVQDTLPKSDVNKEYYMHNIEREIENGDGTNPVGAIGSKSQAPSDMLLKLARTTPYYKRNRPHICSFWVKGECKRGEECPYRHDRPTDPSDPLAEQNIRDRFHGTNDPVADKLIRRYHDMPKLEPPEDKTITTLYVGNLGDKVEEKDLRDHFYQFGQIRSVTVVQKQQCAFVQFTDRSSAEVAGEKSFNRLILKGQRLSIKWGRSQGQSGKKEENDGEEMSEDVTGPGGSKMSPDDTSNNYFNLPPPPMMPPFMQRGPMPMRGPEPPMGNFAIRTPFGMGMNLRPSGPQHFQPPPRMKMQAPCPLPPPSSNESRRPASSAEHSRRSDGVVKPFGAALKTNFYPSQNPNRMGSGSKR